MPLVLVIAGAGLWTQRGWGGILAAVILLCHGMIFLSLLVIIIFGKTVARISTMAVLFRTAIWLVINMVLRWKSESQAGTVQAFSPNRYRYL